MQGNRSQLLSGRQMFGKPGPPCRLVFHGFGKFRRRHRFVGSADGSQQFLPVVRVNLCLFLAACERHVGRSLIGGREGLAGDGHEDLVHRIALAGVARRRIAVGEVPELAVDDPAVIDDEVTPGGEPRDGQD